MIVDRANSELLSCFSIGAVGAQIAMHALWTVFAPVTPLKKNTIAIASALFWYAAGVLGLFAGIYNFYGYGYGYGHRDFFEASISFWPNITAIFLFLPFLVIGSQAPLWVARYFLRWRVVHTADSDIPKIPSPLRIRHIMIATGSVAVALSAGRMAGHLFGNRNIESQLIVSSVVTAAITLFTLLPMTAIILRMRRPLLGLFSLSGLYMGLFILGILILMYFQELPDSEELLIFFALVAAYFGPLGGSLFAIRALGYRLQWGRASKAA